MSFWKLAIVYLVVFSVSADLDTDIELSSDLALHSLRGVITSQKEANGGCSSGFGGAKTELELFEDDDDETVELFSPPKRPPFGLGRSNTASYKPIKPPAPGLKPTAWKPIFPKPTGSKPMRPRPTAWEPVYPKPTAPRPRISKPTATKPVTPTKPITFPTKLIISHPTINPNPTPTTNL